MNPAATKTAALILWAALQLGVLFLLGLAALFKFVQPGGLFVPGAHPVVDVVAASIAAAPVLLGLFVYGRNVVFGPSPNSRVVRSVSKRLAESPASADPDRFAAGVVALLDGNFRGASILAWALGEAGALLAVCVTLGRGFQTPEVAVVALWFLSMAISAPTQSRIDRYRRRLLEHSGLNKAQTETLLAQAGD